MLQHKPVFVQYAAGRKPVFLPRDIEIHIRHQAALRVRIERAERDTLEHIERQPCFPQQGRGIAGEGKQGVEAELRLLRIRRKAGLHRFRRVEAARRQLALHERLHLVQARKIPKGFPLRLREAAQPIIPRRSPAAGGGQQPFQHALYHRPLFPDFCQGIIHLFFSK